MSSADVDPTWFAANSGADPEPSRPLSECSIGLLLVLDRGATSATLTMPTIEDGVIESVEGVRWRATVFGHGPEDMPVGVIDGLVTD